MESVLITYAHWKYLFRRLLNGLCYTVCEPELSHGDVNAAVFISWQWLRHTSCLCESHQSEKCLWSAISFSCFLVSVYLLGVFILFEMEHVARNFITYWNCHFQKCCSKFMLPLCVAAVFSLCITQKFIYSKTSFIWHWMVQIFWLTGKLTSPIIFHSCVNLCIILSCWRKTIYRIKLPYVSEQCRWQRRMCVCTCNSVLLIMINKWLQYCSIFYIICAPS